jgi:hypothetical protein
MEERSRDWADVSIDGPPATSTHSNFAVIVALPPQ